MTWLPTVLWTLFWMLNAKRLGPTVAAFGIQWNVVDLVTLLVAIVATIILVKRKDAK